jgi:hypothetical protein
MFDRKGQIKIIEAFLAVSVMFSALALMAPLSSTPNFERQETLRKLGAQVLIELNQNGTLGKLIESGNWTALEQSVEILLPLGVFFNLTVYGEQMERLNGQVISNINLSEMQSREITSVQYLCATQSSDIHFYTIRLQLAWAE